MRKVVDCEPVGAAILVEMLSSQEALGTTLHIEGKAQSGAPQGSVLKLGPLVYGAGNAEGQVQVGDRVLLSGTFTPVPEFPRENGRMLGLVELHVIKAILAEKSDLEIM